MANIKNLQQDTMATIDAATVLVDKVTAILELFNYSPNLSTNLATNPIGFLMQLLKEAGVTYDQIRDFLSWFLIGVVPALELSTKAILLTNLKNMISCSIDPRIPDQYRKKHVKISDYNTGQRHGINIDVESIDIFDKLSVSPLSEEGSYLYFGLNGVTDVYKFARAEDFDAFLWFVIHMGRFPNSAKVPPTGDSGSFTDSIHGEGSNTVKPDDWSLLAPLEIQYAEGSASSIINGNTFTYDKGSHIISMCIDSVYGEDNKITNNTLVPVSDDWNSVNWYVGKRISLFKNLAGGADFVKKREANKGRDYSKDRPICNLQYIDQASSDSPITGLVNNRLRFTILPKPYIHIPDTSNGEPPWRFKKLLFDAEGNYNGKGRLTIGQDVSSSYDQETGLIKFNFGVSEGEDPGVTMNPIGGGVKVDKPKLLRPFLFECYPGLTVYEFNYDYVMGMKLFDAKVIATQLLDGLINTRVGLNVNLSRKHQDATEEIREIVKTILNADPSLYSDCFYTFDNSKYERLLRKAEEKRAARQAFGNTTTQISSFKTVTDILEEYDSEADLVEQYDIINRTFTQASVILSEGSEAKDRYSVQFGFVCDLVENLTQSIVYAIFSPKLLMLLQVNQVIMGGTWKAFTMKDVIKSLESVITSIIEEIRDLVLQELLKLLHKVLDPLIAMFTSLVINEQVENYVKVIRSLFEDCPILWFRFGNRLENTVLDVVDYADIDTSLITTGEVPEEKC